MMHTDSKRFKYPISSLHVTFSSLKCEYGDDDDINKRIPKQTNDTQAKILFCKFCTHSISNVRDYTTSFFSKIKHKWKRMYEPRIKEKNKILKQSFYVSFTNKFMLHIDSRVSFFVRGHIL